jgi:hypothetical protein
MLALQLTTDKAILLRDWLMVVRQSLKPESRPDIQEILKEIERYLAVELRSNENG